MDTAVDLRRPRPAGRPHRRPPPGRRAGRAGHPDRRAGPLRPARPRPDRLRRPAGRRHPVTGLSDTAALASIGAAARELQLPTVRADAARLAEIAVRERHTHLGYLAEVLSAEVDDRTSRRRARRIAEARFPRLKRLADFSTDAIPGIAATLATLAPGGVDRRRRSRSCCSVTPAPARPTCSSASGWPPASRAAGSATSPPPRWSTSSPKPPTSGSCPAWWPATAAWICSARRAGLRPARPPRRRAAVPDHHRTGGTRLHRHRDQPALQRMGNGVPRPPPRRRDRRPGHLQRPHPRDRHPVLPARPASRQPRPPISSKRRQGRVTICHAADATSAASPSHARCPAPAAASTTAAGPASKRPTGNAADAPPEPPAPSAAGTSTPRPQTASQSPGPKFTTTMGPNHLTTLTPAAAAREHGPGHMVVRCEAVQGCRSAWYKPRHDPDYPAGG